VSINAADYRSMRMGTIPKKKIFGGAIAGWVELVGNSVEEFEVGNEVLGDLSDFGFGGLAEYALAPCKALVKNQLECYLKKQQHYPLQLLQALRDKGKIKKGQKILIVGAAGGVGPFATQLAKYYGGIVTAVCSAKNIKQTRSLGADHVIDYVKEDFTKSTESYDLILAINGNYPLLAYKKILNSDGIL